MAGKKGDIRQQFGLDYLIKKDESIPEESKSQKSGESLFDKVMERTLVIVGGKVLETLKNEPDKSARLHDIVKKTDIPLETLFRVVKQLENLEFVRFVERDKLGNDKIELTQIGEGSL